MDDEYAEEDFVEMSLIALAAENTADTKSKEKKAGNGTD